MAKATVVSPITVGRNVFIRTVTHYFTGTIVLIKGAEIILDKAAWIADTGRFAGAMASGGLNEVEPYPAGTLVSVNREAIIDVSEWKHALPRAQK